MFVEGVFGAQEAPEFDGSDEAVVVGDSKQVSVSWIECYSLSLSEALGSHHRAAVVVEVNKVQFDGRLLFALDEVVDVEITLITDSNEYCRSVRRPFDAVDELSVFGLEGQDHFVLLSGVVDPDLPIRGGRQEELTVVFERVRLDRRHRPIVLQEVRRAQLCERREQLHDG